MDPRKKALTLAGEFKQFALKGNVVDLAVGVIIGTTFGSLVNSLVKNLVMPAVSILLPADETYSHWKWTVAGKDIPYGQFLADVVNFLIVSLVLFFFTVKFLGWILRTKKEEVAAPPPLTKDQELLMEIRDLLKQARAQEPTS
jgi:large conductance mechanosensitive channel